MSNIRVMTINDYEGIYDLWINTPGMGLNSTDDSREGIQKYLKRNPTTSFVAEEQEKIIRVIMAGHDGRRGYIHHTAVLPDYRHQGIGKKSVFLNVKTWYTEIKISTIWKGLILNQGSICYEIRNYQLIR